MEKIEDFEEGSFNLINADDAKKIGFLDKETNSLSLKNVEINNNLIGQFNNDVNYVIDSAILKELIAIAKTITENDAAYSLLLAKIKNENFSLKFSLVQTVKGDLQEKTASLNLLEETSDDFGLNKKTRSTLIASYTDDNDIYFFKKVKAVFNIFEIDDSDGKEENDIDIIPLIFARRQKNKQLKKLLDENENSVDAIYFKEMINILKGYDKYGTFVLKTMLNLKKQYDPKFFDKNNPNYYKNMSKLLEMSMAKASDYHFEPELLAKLTNAKQKHIAGIEEIFGRKPKEKLSEKEVKKDKPKEEKKDKPKDKPKDKKKDKPKDKKKDKKEEKKDKPKSKVEQPNIYGNDGKQKNANTLDRKLYANFNDSLKWQIEKLLDNSIVQVTEKEEIEKLLDNSIVPVTEKAEIEKLLDNSIVPVTEKEEIEKLFNYSKNFTDTEQNVENKTFNKISKNANEMIFGK